MKYIFFLLQKVGGAAEKYEGLLNSWKKKRVNLQQQQNGQSGFGVKAEKIEVFPLERFVIELKRVWKYLHDERFKKFYFECLLKKWSHLYEIHNGWIRKVFKNLYLEKVAILVNLDNLNLLSHYKAHLQSSSNHHHQCQYVSLSHLPSLHKIPADHLLNMRCSLLCEEISACTVCRM